MDQIANGGLLTTAQAATICEVCCQTICRWNDEAARRGEPKQATWLIGTARLLDYVEKYQGGLPARQGGEPAQEALADLVVARECRSAQWTIDAWRYASNRHIGNSSMEVFARQRLTRNLSGRKP
jgi:hypothetical protein